MTRKVSTSKSKKEWKKKRYDKQSIIKKNFKSISFRDINELNSFDEQKKLSAKNEIGYPGEFPYTRGIHASMYRGKVWTMRQFAGFGSPEDTNKRFLYLLQHGQTGLSTAFDMPSLMGYDCDHERSKGEVGREGVSVSSIDDMERLFKGIDQSAVTVSMTINATATIIMAMYLAIAKRRNLDLNKIGGTIQNDMLKEFIAQKEWICPPAPSVKLNCDIIEYCAKHARRFNGVSISGYHIREAGATAVQELAFTIADGLAYVDDCLSRGMKIDDFANRLSFFFDVHNDFFEEIAKFRAARRLWAKLIKERYKAKDENSLKLRTHAQTAGVSLTAQQPVNNVARVALQAMAAVLGGVQSLHTNSMDETLSLPTEEAVKVALRTQQIIAEETGVVNNIDPLGGSYYIEDLTNKMEQDAYNYIKKIDKMGGMLKAVESGYPQKEISESSYRFQLMVEAEEYSIVGLNKYTDQEEQEIPTLEIDFQSEKAQISKLKAFKSKRNKAKYNKTKNQLISACKENRNVMPYLIEAVDSGMTLGEISDIYRDIFGIYTDQNYI